MLSAIVMSMRAVLAESWPLDLTSALVSSSEQLRSITELHAEDDDPNILAMVPLHLL